MNLNQLVYFSAVARNGTYSRAAEEVGVSEPAVHRAVRSLERTYQVKLLRRTQRGVHLTAQGEVIYRYAERVASFGEMAERAALEQRGEISGRLTIGSAITGISTVLPSILPKWIAEHPLVEISIAGDDVAGLQAKCLEGRLDIIVCTSASWDPRLRRQLIFSDRLVMVASPEHPLVNRESISVADLSREAIILTPRGGSVRGELEDVAQRYGVQLRRAVEVNLTDVARPLCEAGLGIALMPMSVVAKDVSSKRLAVLNVEGFPRVCPFFLAYRADRVLTAEMKSFLYAVQLWIQSRDSTLDTFRDDVR